MSNQQERAAEDHYEAQNDAAAPVSGSITDDSYKATSTGGAIQNPVVSDVEGTRELEDQPPQNSDVQLARDEDEAVDKSNIISGRTRGSKPQGPGYNEGPGEDDLPAEVTEGITGTSTVPRTEAQRRDVG